MISGHIGLYNISMHQKSQFSLLKRDKKNKVEYIAIETIKPIDFENKSYH